MIRRTRNILLTGTALAAIGVTMGVLALSRFSDSPFALLFERRERVVVDLPQGIGRVLLSRVHLEPFLDNQARWLTVQRAGQTVVETPLFPPRDEASAITVRWHDGTSGQAPAFLHLVEPGGEILVDVDSPAVVRVIRTAVGPVLTSPRGDARVGAIMTPDGTVRMTNGLPATDLPVDDPGIVLGVIREDADGRLSFEPEE